MENEPLTDPNSVTGIIPVVRRGVYSLCYYLAFCAVYAGELAMEALPGESVIREGLRDGAAAARRAYSRDEDIIAAAEMELPVVEAAIAVL